MVSNRSSLSLLTVLKPGSSSHSGAEPKPAKTINQMIDLMVDRGLVVTNEKRLRQVLFDCNYYRLSGYFRPFQINPAAGNNYKTGTRDLDFLIPYSMDETLRNIMLKGVAKIELAIQSRFAYLLACYVTYSYRTCSRNHHGIALEIGECKTSIGDRLSIFLRVG